MDKLTEKQKKFADAYMICGNAEQAAKSAGYNARGNTTKLMRNTTIVAYIEKRAKAQQLAEDKAIASSVDNGRIADMQEVKEFWTTLMRDRFTKDSDRLKAAELLAKTNGAFIDKVEHSGSIELPSIKIVKTKN